LRNPYSNEEGEAEGCKSENSAGDNLVNQEDIPSMSLKLQIYVGDAKRKPRAAAKRSRKDIYLLLMVSTLSRIATISREFFEDEMAR
jgi:hypothetical protein